MNCKCANLNFRNLFTSHFMHTYYFSALCYPPFILLKALITVSKSWANLTFDLCIQIWNEGSVWMEVLREWNVRWIDDDGQTNAAVGDSDWYDTNAKPSCHEKLVPKPAFSKIYKQGCVQPRNPLVERNF